MNRSSWVPGILASLIISSLANASTINHHHDTANYGDQFNKLESASGNQPNNPHTTS